MRTATLEPKHQTESQPTPEVAVEDLAEILEPTDVSTLEIALPSKADKVVLIGGLLVAFAVGAGFVLLVVQARSAAPQRALVTRSFTRVTSPKQPAPRALVAPESAPSSSAPTASSKTVAPRRRIPAANPPAADSPATPSAAAGGSADDWVDPFDAEATPEEPPSDEWKDPFTEPKTTSE